MPSDASSVVSSSVPTSSSGGLMVPDGAEPTEAPISARDLYVKEEQCQLGIQILKEEEQEISQQIEEFEREKAVLICDLKWMRDQSESHFRDFPSLNHGQYLILELLGKGGFSEVHRGYDVHNCVQVACKVHQLRSEWTQERKHNYARHSMREYHIQSRLRHPNVVRLYDVFEIDQDSFCTVMEYVDGVDLDQFLKKNKNMCEKDSKAVLLQILCGVKYLHEQKQRIIHYDMKPANILMHEGMVKITDFGLSKVMEEESDKIELTSQGAGTYWYLPPECFVMDKDKAPRISPKVDVWAVGIIFYEMLYGRRPFGDGMTQQGLLHEGTILKASTVEFQPVPGIKASVSEEAKVRGLSFHQLFSPSIIPPPPSV
jgi:tousled-like kinase